MKIKILLTSIIICMISGSVSAQKEYQIEKVSVINYGDGRLLFRTNDDKEEPLNGKHRIIDGYRSEYILAEFKDGMFHGEYQHFVRTKLRESSQYKEGRKHGVSKEYFSDSEAIKVEEHYKDGNKHGVSKEYFSDGKTVEKEYNFKDGKPDGILKTYDNKGKIQTEKGYKDGVEHGVDRAYNSDGKITREATYVNGKAENAQTQSILSSRGNYNIKSNNSDGLRDGEYIETYEDGNPKTKGAYKAGKKDGRWETYKKDGLPDKVVTYRSEELHGESITYYTDGSVNEIINYADGKKDGKSKEFYFRTGYPKSEYTYSKGKRNGDFKRYYDENNLKEEGRYENDSEVYIKTYYKDGKLESIKERKSGSFPWTYIEYLNSDGTKRKAY